MKTKVLTAADGSTFGPHCERAGGFWVGPKGKERKHARIEDAEADLRSMPRACWRRRNANGNWGLVTGCWA
jgi:hypothetical protein